MFSNYFFEITLINLDDGQFDFEWINDRRAKDLKIEKINDKAPKKWKNWVVGLWIQIHIGICRFNTRFLAISPQITPDDGVNIKARQHILFIPPR